MKRIFTIIACALYATMGFAQGANGYKISLKGFDLYDGEKVYLYKPAGRTAIAIDSAIVANKELVFQGELTDQGGLRVVAKDLKKPQLATFLLEAGEILLQKKGDFYTIAGTPGNVAYSQFMEETRPFTEKMREIVIAANDTTITKEQREELIEKYYAVEEQKTEKAYTTMKANLDNLLGVFLFKTTATHLEIDQAAAVMDKIPAKYVDEEVEKIKAYISTAIKTQAGKEMTDFTLNSPEGTPVTLSEIVKKNKYTLVDFWASWCGPCRADMPHIVEVYKAYKEKGLEIVGVSLDNDEKAWKEALTTMNMTWPQMSDLKGWRSEGAGLYAVRSIPATVLIDQNGIIVARDLRGKTLDDKLAELLK